MHDNSILLFSILHLFIPSKELLLLWVVCYVATSCSYHISLSSSIQRVSLCIYLIYIFVMLTLLKWNTLTKSKATSNVSLVLILLLLLPILNSCWFSKPVVLLLGWVVYTCIILYSLSLFRGISRTLLRLLVYLRTIFIFSCIRWPVNTITQWLAWTTKKGKGIQKYILTEYLLPIVSGANIKSAFIGSSFLI